MVYIPVDFDIDDFLARIQGTKPPFVCPADICQKTFKSYSNIQKHMTIHRPPAPIEIHAIPVGLNGAMHKTEKACTIRTLSVSGQKENLSGAHRSTLYNDPNSFVLLEGKGNGITQSFRCSIFVPLTFHIQNLQNPAFKNSDNTNSVKIDDDSSKPTKSDQLAHRKRSFSRQKFRIRNGGSNGCTQKKSTSCSDNQTNTSHQAPRETSPGPPPLTLPKAVFEVDSAFTLKKPVLQNEAAGYIRHIDHPADELDEIVEYDLDEEDLFWLDQVNLERRSRGLKDVSETTLEWVIDRFEKESKFRFFSADGNPMDDVPPSIGLSHSGIDEDAVCAVCQDGTCENTNVILFCDVCNLAVHQECYGVPYVPEGPWLCRKCLHSPSEPVSCVLCPNRDGAFKKTSDDRWAHVICGLWVPEVMFANLTFLEPLEGIDQIATARWRLLCFICKQRNAGACIQCHKINCYRAFHVTCAQSAGLYMKIEHSDDGDGLTSGGAGDAGIRKNAYCDQHCPPNHFKSSNKGMYANSDSESPQSPEQAARLQLRKARKVLAERRNSKPSMCVPIVPKNMIDMIRSKLTADSPSLVDIPKFLTKAYAFWKLKREVRRGVPLLKRLQASSVHRNAANFAAAATVGSAESQRMRAHLQFWQQLRQDLERARLLAELTRKRERVKRHLFRVHATSVELQIRPMSVILSRLLDQLQTLDNDQIFSEPVTADMAPDYSEIIRHPMDFSTMRSKLDVNAYSSIPDLEEDFNLMLSNCRKYNRRDSVYYAAALRLADKGRPIFDFALVTSRALGINTLADLLPNSLELSDDILPGLPTELPVDSPAPTSVMDSPRDVTPRRGMKIDHNERGDDDVERQTVVSTVHRACGDKEVGGRMRRRSVVCNTRRRLRSNGSQDSYPGTSQPVPLPAADTPSRESQSMLECVKTRELGNATPSVSLPTADTLGKPIATGLVGRKRRRSSASSGGSPHSRRQSATTGDSLRRSLSTTTTAGGGIKKLRLEATSVDSDVSNKTDTNNRSVLASDLASGNSLFASVNKLRSTQAKWSISLLDGGAQEGATGVDTKRPSPVVGFASTSTSSVGVEKRPAFTNYRLTKVNRWEDEEDDDEEDEDSEDSDEEQVEGNIRSSNSQCPSAGRRQQHQLRPRYSASDVSQGQRLVDATARPTVIVTVVGKSCLAADALVRPSNKLRRPLITKDEADATSKTCIGRRANQSGRSAAYPVDSTTADPADNESGLRKSAALGTEKSSASDISVQDHQLTGSTSGSYCLPIHYHQGESPAPLSVNTTGSSGTGGACTTDVFEILTSPTGGSTTPAQIAFLNVVWAKCRGSPWYPGLVVDPEAGEGYSHNGVPIPAPPPSVLELGRKLVPYLGTSSADTSGSVLSPSAGVFLILFFDAKRTWQWLPSHKLELLNFQAELDKLHLAEARRSKMKHAVIKAYHRAIEHLCKVHGRPYPYPESKDSNVTFTL